MIYKYILFPETKHRTDPAPGAIGGNSGQVDKNGAASPTHYSAAELESLIAAAERVCGQKSRKISALVVLKRKSG